MQMVATENLKKHKPICDS